VEYKGILAFACGIGFFLFGMYQMGEGLRVLVGDRMKKYIRFMAVSPWRAVLTGAGVTSLIQSSSAATVLVVQLTDVGVLTLWQAAGMIMGANIGTCITAWMSGAGVRISEAVAGCLAVAAVLLLLHVRFGRVPEKKSREARKGKSGFVRRKQCAKIVSILFGFGLLLIGMEGMKIGLSPIARRASFRQMLTQFQSPLHGVAAGAMLTAVIQSSSACVGILQALSSTGAMTYKIVMPVILGQNIGTCVTALMSCFGTGRNGKIAALFHLLFNLIGTGIFLVGLYGLRGMEVIPFGEKKASAMGIALAHTVFNMATTVVLLPMLYILSDATESSGVSVKKSDYSAEV